MAREQNNFETDSLEKLQISEYERVLNLLRKDWPTYIHLYYYVEENKRWKMKDPEIAHDIYYPRGNIESGIFIGISNIPAHAVTFLGLGEDENLLKEVLSNTQRIHWFEKRGWVMGGLHKNFFQTIFSIVGELRKESKVPNYFDIPGNIYVKSCQKCLSDEITVPDDCYLSEIKQEHIETIHSVWPHKKQDYPEISRGFLSTLNKMNEGIGLFSKSNNELMSWVLWNEFGGLGMAQTLSQHQRKGYAQIVIKYLAQKIARMTGRDSVAFIVDGNKPSENMFKKLGYARVNGLTWILFSNKQ